MAKHALRWRLARLKARRILLALPLAAAVAVVLATTALAYPWDGSDPNATGCSGSAWSPMSRWIDQGYLELRYSNGCQTAWARFTCQKWPACTNYDIKVHRNQDNWEYWNGVRFPHSTGQNRSLYTLQLFDGIGFQADACYRAAATQWVWQCIGPY